MTWTPYKNTGIALPTTSFNLRYQFGPIENEGPLGACTAFATLQCFAAMRKKQGYAWTIFSPLGEWFASKVLYGKQHNIPDYAHQNNGVTEDDALEVLCVDGVMPMQDDPWNQKIMNGNWVLAYETPPPSGDWVSSIKLRRSEVYEISLANANQSLLDVRDALANGNAVLLSLVVWSNWFNLPPDGIIPMPPQNQAAVSEHEINIIGDDPANQRLLILNQWGPLWGVQTIPELAGCAWLPYEYLMQYAEALYVLIPDASVPPAPHISPKKEEPTPTMDAVQGFDASQFEGDINMGKVAVSKQFGIFRSNIGRTQEDEMFAANYKNASEANLIRGAYQFAYPIDDSALASYAAYESTVQRNGGFQLPPIVDIEQAGCGDLSPEVVTDWAVVWLTQAISDYGRAIVYSDEDYFASHLSIARLPEGTILWVANYSAEPTLPWAFWQKSRTGRIDGISGDVDLDVFRGSIEDLLALTKLKTPTHKEDETMETVHIQLNGKDVAVPGVMYDGNTCIPWTVLQEILPGVKAVEKDAKPYGTTYAFDFEYTKPAPVVEDEKPIKATVTLTYADGTTQTL